MELKANDIKVQCKLLIVILETGLWQLLSCQHLGCSSPSVNCPLVTYDSFQVSHSFWGPCKPQGPKAGQCPVLPRQIKVEVRTSVFSTFCSISKGHSSPSRLLSKVPFSSCKAKAMVQAQSGVPGERAAEGVPGHISSTVTEL